MLCSFVCGEFKACFEFVTAETARMLYFIVPFRFSLLCDRGFFISLTQKTTLLEMNSVAIITYHP
jgi:hypothetical protein